MNPLHNTSLRFPLFAGFFGCGFCSLLPIVLALTLPATIPSATLFAAEIPATTIPVSNIPKPKSQRPNILLLVADDMGFSDAGCYGGEITTPNLDNLAKNGLRFTQFYNTARCWSTRTALMTGYYPQQVRSDPIVKGSRLPKGVKVIPHYLKQLGYRCYHSGKWHVPGAPLPCADGGFDQSYELLDHNRNFNPQQHRRNDQPLPPIQPNSGFYTTSFIAQETINQLKEHATQTPDTPFFAFTAFTAPHFPLHAPQEVIALYRERYNIGWETIRRQRFQRLTDMGIIHCPLSPPEREVGPPYSQNNLAPLGTGEIFKPLAWNDLTKEQQNFQATKMAIHAAMVEIIDREIGNILDQLRSMKAIENTLIFFLSDNGCSAEIMIRGDGHDPEAKLGSAETFLCLGPGWSTASNTPFRRHKVWTLEGGISTPLIVSWMRDQPQPLQQSPQSQPSQLSQSSNRPANTNLSVNGLRHDFGHVVDLLPTILDAAGYDHDQRNNEFAPLPGESLFPAITGSVDAEPRKRAPIYFSHEGNRAVRDHQFKLVSTAKNRQGDGVWRLYDMRSDRSEQQDLSQQFPEKVEELRQIWQQFNEQFQQNSKRE
ncbi:MAG: arylsulfatase [Planctomycetaceae bacterium]|jgi:arylsulfatase|nr:arylsulfatase [Planctomycetaceae bacterium]